MIPHDPSIRIPFTDLYIYYLKGHIDPSDAFFGDTFLGNWEEDDFSLTIVQKFKKKKILANEFKEQFDGRKLKAKEYISSRKKYYYSTYFDNSKLNDFFKIQEDYNYNIDVEIRAFFGNDRRSTVSVFHKRLSL